MELVEITDRILKFAEDARDLLAVKEDKQAYHELFLLHRFLLDELPDKPEPKINCRKCGCTDDKPCIDADHLACFWVEPDLCSECSP